MKKLLLPVSLSAFAAIIFSCAGNKTDTNTSDTLITDTPVVSPTDVNTGNDKITLNTDSIAVNTSKEQGAAQKQGETNAQGSSGKGTIENLSTGKTEVVKHGSDNQTKLDSIKNAKQKQRGN